MNTNNMRQIVVTVLILAVTSTYVSAQTADNDRKFGISASLQEARTEISFPWWTSDRSVIIPSFSFVSASDHATDIGLGLGLRRNTGSGDAVPYFGIQAGLLIFSPDRGDNVTDFMIGPMVGGEYFFSDHFSVGVEAQLNVTVADDHSNRWGNPGGTNVNTATAALATFYF